MLKDGLKGLIHANPHPTKFGPNFLVGHFHSLDMEKEKQQAT